MEVHARAPLSPIGRRRVVDRVRGRVWSVTAAAEAAGVTERTVYRWLARFRWGQRGLWIAAGSRPPHKTPADRVRVICGLRRLQLTAAEIAEVLRCRSRPCRRSSQREGLGKRSRLAAGRAGQPLRAPGGG